MADAGAASGSRRNKKIGIFGGTFDPIHRAHLAAAASAAEALDLDRVLFMVAAKPWQKQGRNVTPARHRLAMVRSAVADEQRFEASDLEIVRGGLTYTVDTLRALRKRHPDAEFYLVVGTDIADTIHSWKGLDELRRGLTLAVMHRPPYRVAKPTGFVEMAVPHKAEDLASTQVRERLRAGEPVAGLLPPAVLEYIRQHGLYR